MENSEFTSHQNKLMHIVLNHPEKVADFVSTMKPEYFDSTYRPLSVFLRNCHTKSEPPTKNSYKEFITKACRNGDFTEWTGTKDPSEYMVVNKQSDLFSNATSIESAIRDDFDFYCGKIKENFAFKKANEALQEYSSEKTADIYKAAAKLSDSLKMVSGEGDAGRAEILDGSDYGDAWIKQLRHRRVNPEQRLLTGFPEIDYCISVGLKDGMLTLFVADVGGFKTTMMLNVAMNIFKASEENVLFVPLEMPAEMLMHKVISRETRVQTRKLENAHLLTDEEIEKAARELEKWKSLDQKFVMLDPQDRLRVSDIRKLIEENYAWFKPKVVVIDYISIMRPEVVNERAPNHEQIGHICKDLRQLGRTMGFSVISAAQLGRDAIKKHRKEKEGQQTVGSEDVRGSHDFSADSDNIFAQVPLPSQPSEKLQLFCIKARYGSKTFEDGKPYAVLNVAPDISRITSEQDAVWGAMTPVDPSIQHAEASMDQFNLADDLDLDFGEEETSKPVVEELNSDELFGGNSEKNNITVFDDFD